MPADRDPKDHYSYEEMVERLRDQRSDGSRIKSEEREFDPETGKVTVRRQKKRRTSSTKSGLLKDPKWFRLLRKLGYIGFPVLVVLMVVSYAIVAASVGTGRFQDGLGQSLARQFHLPEPATIKESSLRGLTLTSKNISLPGPTGSMLRAASLDGVELRLSPGSLLGGNWTVESCVISRAQLTIGAPTATVAGFLSPATPRLVPAGFLLSDDPSHIALDDITIGQVNLLFGAADPAKAHGLRSVRASLLKRTPEAGDGTSYLDTQISGGREGTLSLPGWPAFKVETMRMELRPAGATIKRSVLHLGAEDEAKAKAGVTSIVEAKGTIPFQAGEEAAIDLATRSVLLSDLMPKAANRTVSGVLRAENLRLTYLASDPATTWRLQGAIHIDLARLRGLRLLAHIQQITGGEMTSFDFEDCSMSLDMTPAGTILSDIRAIGAGRAHITGTLSVGPKGDLMGDLRLGLANEILLEKVPEFFKSGEESSSWTEVKVAGTAAAPSEDLSARIQAWLATQPAGSNRAVPPPDTEMLDPAFEEERPPARPGPATTPPAGAEEERLQSLFDNLLKETPAPEEAGQDPVR